MTKNSKIRGIVWLTLVLIGVTIISINSYTEEDTTINWEEYFQSRSEDQAGIDYLEIISYKYEHTPIISVSSSDYTFDIHRMVAQEFNVESDLYIVGKNIEMADKAPELGIIDVILYCSTEDNLYEEEVGFSRLQWLSGTNVLIGSIEIDSCSGNEYSLIIDGSNVEDVYGRQEIEIIHLEDHYDVDEYLTAAQVEEKLNLKDGFQRDYNKAGFIQYNWEKALVNGLIALVIMLPIAYGLFYATEKELFGINISRRGNKK
ncbi:hypothetical protein RI065_04990 [Mycoplasmatota bacterium zrk1]